MASTPPPVPTDFIELLNPVGDSPAECLIELEGASGGRMRIQMKVTPPEISRLIRAWRESEA
jgi:hypothetical protein